MDEIELKETRTEFTRLESDDGVKLVIKEVTSELSGQYTCKLSNECGQAETSAKLTVNCKYFRYEKITKRKTKEETQLFLVGVLKESTHCCFCFISSISFVNFTKVVLEDSGAYYTGYICTRI